MAIHKLNIDSFEDIDFEAIGICCEYEGYRLAFLINQRMPINLAKSNKDICIDIEEQRFNFTVFSYFDKKRGVSWDLIQNKTTLIEEKKSEEQNLFSDIETELTINGCLLPEYKQLDFFLKISNTHNTEAQEAEQALNSIQGVLTVQSIDLTQTKFKSNLIF